MKLTLILLLLLSSTAKALLCPELLQQADSTETIFHIEIPTPRDEETLEKIASELSDLLVSKLKVVVSKNKIRLQRKVDRYDWNSVDYSGFVLEELVQNAGRWGNQRDSTKPISIRTSFNSEGVFVEVKDRGDKPFNPAEDPFSLQDGETTKEFKERRRIAGKLDGEGVFWADAKNNSAYAYEFISGSRLVLFTPWNFLLGASP